MYIQRTLEKGIALINQEFPALLVIGPRQVGKTTFLKHLAKEGRTYVTLDDPLLANLAREEPQLFLERYKTPILIDEIQYAPQLLPYIKMDIDEHHNPGDYWLTGSQQFQLMKGVSESLAGRIGIINLLGFSQWEKLKLAEIGTPFLPEPNIIEKRIKYYKRQSINSVYKQIWLGSFPALTIQPNIDKELFYSSYVQTYLQRDLRALTHVGNESQFLRFLQITAARTGQMINIADLSRDADISPNTAKSWLSILESTGIIYLLQPYHNNVTKRLVKAPKLYFLDTGICTYLTKWSSPETLEAGAMSGAIFETFIISEILKSYWHNAKQAPFYYYRDKDQKEIDLLILQNETIYPIEIKKTSQPNRDHTKHFSALKKLHKKIGSGALVCLINSTIPISPEITALPSNLI